jgi:hypothetical protein
MNLGQEVPLTVSFGMLVRRLNVPERCTGPAGEQAAFREEAVGCGRVQHRSRLAQPAQALFEQC